MTWKDKLEIGLKNDAPFRKDNLFPDQVQGPEVASGPGGSPVVPQAQEDHADEANQTKKKAAPERPDSRPVDDLPPQD